MSAQSNDFELTSFRHVVLARQHTRQMARDLGFGATDQTRIATAVSEVAHQIVEHQAQGSIALRVLANGSRRGLECTCVGGPWRKPCELGPGPIPEELRGVSLLVDHLELTTRDDEVVVIMQKWLRKPEVTQ